MLCSCGKECGTFKQCYKCLLQTKDKCICGKFKLKKYKICYTCLNCAACNGTGTAYWSDDIYGYCLDCAMGDHIKKMENA